LLDNRRNHGRMKFDGILDFNPLFIKVVFMNIVERRLRSMLIYVAANGSIKGQAVDKFEKPIVDKLINDGKLITNRNHIFYSNGMNDIGPVPVPMEQTKDVVAMLAIEGSKRENSGIREDYV